MKYGRINYKADPNYVIEIFIPSAGVPITDCFTPEIAAQFEIVPPEVDQNWIKQADGTFIAAPTPLIEEPTSAE